MARIARVGRKAVHSAQDAPVLGLDQVRLGRLLVFSRQFMRLEVAAKAGVAGLTRSLAIDLGPEGITANVRTLPTVPLRLRAGKAGVPALLAVRGESYENAAAERRKDLFIGAIALTYAVWLIYAGGVKYLLLSALLYAPGAILFAKAKLEVNKPVFTNVEKLIFAAVVVGALVAAYGLYDGFLTL